MQVEPSPRRRTARWIAAGTLALLVCGCAYFNTFYNANKLFEDAERIRGEKGGSADRASAQYDACIKKCLDLLRYHPNSKYVDDALYMIGVSHFHRGETMQAQASFRDLLERFPQTGFGERAWFHLGLAALAQGDRAGAAAAFETLERNYPSSPFKVDAAYRTAEALLEAKDNEATRRALLEFIAANPNSRHVAAAQMRIAHAYYDDLQFPEARAEYTRALQHDLSDQQRYEVELQIALTKREEAASILADPALYTEADLPPGLRLLIQEANPDSAAVVTTPVAAVVLPESLRVQRDNAQGLLTEAAADLERLRKRASKLGVELDLRIERAVTIGLQGDPEEALAELDQIARTEPRTAVGAKANYEIGEIHRRLGRWSKAQEGYDASARSASETATAKLAQKKSTAIRARTAALEKLRDAPEVRRRWRVLRGLEPPQAGEADQRGADSLRAAVETETRFEALAAQLLRVAEIDLFELGQPRLALYECQQLLTDYAGSGQCPRAALGIGWIYDQYLSEPLSALKAYDHVVLQYPDSPQAQQAREFAAALRDAMTAAQEEPSSQP